MITILRQLRVSHEVSMQRSSNRDQQSWPMLAGIQFVGKNDWVQVIPQGLIDPAWCDYIPFEGIVPTI